MSGDRVAYARALSWLEEHRAATPELVLGANGGVLTMRIRRLLGYGESPVVSRSVAATLLVGASVLAGSYLVTVARAQARLAEHPMAVVALESGAPSQTMLKLVQSARWLQMALEGEAKLQQTGQTSMGDLKPPYSTWLNQDVLWIITPEERADYMRLSNDQERDDFIARFWALRDPPSAAPDSFKEEHYARIRYSNEHFASDKHVGWRTDRGHVYIVYGKPDDVDSHPTGGVAAAYPFEVWHYRHIGGVGDNVDIKFVDTCRCGEYHYTIDRPGQPGIGPGMSSLQTGQAAVELTARILAPGGGGAAPQSAASAAAAAAYTDAAQANGAIAGVIVDPTGALVPRAQVTATNTDTGVQVKVSTDNTGKYFLSPLPAGPYNVEVFANGFKRLLQENVQVAAKQQVELDMKLSVGAENTTVSVKGTPAPPAPPPAPVMKVPAGKPSGPQRVSSGTLAGNLISKVDPVYPDDAKAARVQGVVVLRAVIAKDGTIEKLTYISGPPPLVVSAIEAVQQWKYKPYLLNGEPTEVETTINVNYTFEGAASLTEQDHGWAQAEQEYRDLLSAKQVGNGVSAPVLTHQVPPEYTPEARQAKTEGIVLVNLFVDGNGVPRIVHVVRGVGNGLDEKAMEAVKQYRFKPAMEDGKPVAVEMNVEVNFKIF
jgi:TonB family protein